MRADCAEDIRDEPHHQDLAPLLQVAQLTGPTKAPVTPEHGRLLQGTQRVDRPRQEGGLPQVLPSTAELQQLRCEPLLSDPWVAQQPVAALQRTAELHAELSREVTGHGHGGRSGRLGNHRAHGGERFVYLSKSDERSGDFCASCYWRQPIGTAILFSCHRAI
jgi:hypothetical protein